MSTDTEIALERLQPYVGCAPTLAQLYADHAASLFRLACLLVFDSAAAEDLVHDAFVRVVGRTDRLTDRSRAGSYLRTVLVNLARSRGRHQLVVLRHPPPVDRGPAGPEEVAVVGSEHQAVVDALRRLPARQRECLVCRHYASMHDAEIAHALGISVGSVSTHVQRGMAALRVSLGGLE